MDNSFTPPRALTIAGTDSGGCAGVLADIKTFSALGVFGTAAIVAVTSQNTLGVSHVEALSAKSLSTQIDAVLSDIGADAVKTGMLFSAELIEVVADRLKYWKVENFVLDPVMVASTKAALLQKDTNFTMMEKLFGLASVITPNLYEAEVLSGITIKNNDDKKKAMERIIDKGANSVLLKGGHGTGKDAVDLWFDGHSLRKFNAPRINTRNTHGTGCTYSAAITAFLAKKLPLEEAIREAKKYIAAAIKEGASISIGNGAGPVSFFNSQMCVNE